jgi:hypothetical protein
MPRIKVKEPKTNQWKNITISQAQFKALHDLNEGKTVQDKILKSIEDLDTTPETKSFLESVLNYTINAGGTIIKVGKKVVEIILSIHKHFPKALLGAVIGLVIGSIISKIPLLGWVLSWVLTPLATVAGAMIGAKKDIADKNLLDKVESKIDSVFAGIKTINI